MEPVSFVDVDLGMVPAAGGGDEVVLSTVVSAGDGRVLADALAWQRAQDHQVSSLHSADHVLALRALVALIDEVELVAGTDEGGPLVLTGAKLRLLAESACRYVSERDEEGYLPAEDRERLERLRGLTGPLFEAAARVAEAERHRLAQVD